MVVGKARSGQYLYSSENPTARGQPNVDPPSTPTPLCPLWVSVNCEVMVNCEDSNGQR